MAIKGEEKCRGEGTGLYTVGVGCNWLFMGYDVLYKACVNREKVICYQLKFGK